MSDIFVRIAQGLSEALDHASGKEVLGLRIHIPQSINVAAIRARAGLSQNDFSQRIGVSAATLKNWEQGRRQPEGPARVLLAMLEKNPRIVEELLSTSHPA